MFERYDHYQSLDPLQTLRLLTAFVERNPEFARVLQAIELKPSVTPFGTRIDLRFKRKRGRWQAEAREQFHALFADNPETARFVEKVRVTGSYLPVMAAVPNLLRAEAPPQDALEHGYLPDEKLLLARDPGVERGRAIYESLRLHATQVRLGMVQGKDTSLYCYHLLDDEKRQSSFQGAVAGELFADCTLLHTYTADVLRGDDPYRVFLPEDMQPTRDVIALFVRLLLAAPSAFGVRGTGQANITLAAITPDELIYIGHTRFHNTWEMGRVLPFDRYHVLKAKDPKRQMAALQAQIDDAAPDAGYRVHLREMHYTGQDEAQAIRQEYEQLKRQMAVLQDRLVELEALRVPRPRLLRFTQAQLPALVSVLRRYRPQDLGNLRYSFQATETQPEGVHYLYIEPQANAYGLDPLVWADLNRAEPIGFWLDPTWAAHYNRSPNRIALFVPQGQRLYPAMHSWKPAQMDQYLRAMMGRVPLPEHPLYVITAGEQPDDLLVSVLDYTALAPLTSPQIVGWINDNLTVLRSLQDVGADLQKIAQAQTRREHYEAIRKSAQDLQQQFADAAQVVEQDYTQFVGELLQTLEAEYQRVNTDAKTFIAHVRKLDKRLGQLVDAHDTVQKRVSDVEALLDESRKAVKGLGTSVETVENQVQRAIQNATSTRNRLDEQVRAKVDDLKRRRQELENKIAELERLL